MASPFPSPLRLAALALLATPIALVAFAPHAGSAPLTLPEGPLPREITISIHYSRFSPSVAEVPAGVPITFTLRNEDPIDHEWLIGDDAFHLTHRAGTELVHGDRPNEVSLPPLATRTTTLTFAHTGAVTFICHFPGHEAYGMVGILTVK